MSASASRDLHAASIASVPRSAPVAGAVPAARADLADSPAPHTAAELARVLRMLTTIDARLVSVGHGRDATSVAAAAAFARAWEAAGGELVAVVDWAPTGASWLRPAQRLTAGQPDAWVIADTPAGWARMSRRLRESTAWDPARTIGFDALGDVRLVELAGAATVAGMLGATCEGGMWHIVAGRVVRHAPLPPRAAAAEPPQRAATARRGLARDATQ